jgi:hypothetical protein
MAAGLNAASHGATLCSQKLAFCSLFSLIKLLIRRSRLNEQFSYMHWARTDLQVRTMLFSITRRK